MSLPQFAIVGHPNEGKSSVVSTLTEDDSVPVSPTPGETRRCRAYTIDVAGKARVRFIDTPGFQNPEKVLEWFRAYRGKDSRLLSDFLAAHRDNPAFHHDVELLGPLAERAGILYVVDASRPLRDSDRQEMEILRLTGLPRMALLNRKRDRQDDVEAWRTAFSRSFNLVRDFNAHHASFRERLALLESLKSLNQDWERPLAEVVEGLRANWRERLEEAVLALEQCLEDAVRLEERLPWRADAEEKVLHAEAVRAYQTALREREASARADWRRIFQHTALRGTDPDADLASADLFAKRVWELLGLSRSQLAWAGAVTGALLGVGVDVAAGGITFGVFTAGGALAGGLAGWFGGPGLGRKRISLPGGLWGRDLAREYVRVGPCDNVQLVFVLLDRSLLYLTRLMNWAHARRDREAFLASLGDAPGFVSAWPEAKRKVVVDWFAAVRGSGKVDRTKATQALRTLLRDVLATHSGGDKA